MTQDKMRRIITACVAAATVLLTCLSLFIGYQWITLGVLNQREKALKDDIKKYEAILEKDNKDKAYYESDLYKDYAYWQLQMSGGNK
jgi:hypothetical protein